MEESSYRELSGQNKLTKENARVMAKHYLQEFLQDEDSIKKILSYAKDFLKNIQPERVFAYYPVSLEIPVLDLLADYDGEVYVPVLQDKDMVYALYSYRRKKYPLVKNKFGIPEPDLRQSKVSYPGKGDVVIVPSLGCNPDFARLGRGGGYYDRFFSKFPESGQVKKVALIPEILTRIPFFHEEWDLILDFLVTEKNIVYRV